MSRGMSWAELTERLTSLIVEQADIIKTQADALAQFGAVEGLDERIRQAEDELRFLAGE